jgi:hypothetical protein
MELREYILHPFHALQSIYGYTRNPDIRKTLQKTQGQVRARKSSWLSQYFESLYARNRIELYASYRELDNDPLVAAIMDTYAEACTQPNSEGITASESGRVVWPYSKNKDIQTILVKLFDKLQIDAMAFPTIRELAVYGDHFEGIPSVRNEGIVRFDPYDPWEVAKILDTERRLSGFAQADDWGEPANTASVVPFYRFLHFKMRERRRTSIYGAESAMLFNVREVWQELQWMYDKVMIDRLRKTDRLLILLDTGGMSSEDTFETIEEIRRWMYREQYFDPAKPELSNMPVSMGEHRDIILPTGSDNRTSIQNAPASGGGAMDDLVLFLRRFFGAIRFPAGYLGFDIGGSFDHAAPIEKQDIAFARACAHPQRSFLSELTRACMIHLIYNNIDPLRPENRFYLLMTPVSAYQEIERKELVSLRYDLMDRAMRLGQENQWDMKFWAKYVMMEYAHMPEDFVEQLLKKPEAIDQAAAPDSKPVSTTVPGDSSMPGANTDNKATSVGGNTGNTIQSVPGNLETGYDRESDIRPLVEKLRENPKALAALTFLKDGAAMASVQDVKLRVPREHELDEAADAKYRGRVPLENKSCDKIFENIQRLRTKAKGESIFGTYMESIETKT